MSDRVPTPSRTTLAREAPVVVRDIDIVRYPKVNEYASAPDSLKVTSTVRSRTPSC
jgi:hypothetical protein